MRAGGNSSKTGATAAEAVNLSDDDDDVVIIEEGMQPQSATTAPAKQPGQPSSTHMSVTLGATNAWVPGHLPPGPGIHG